MNLTDLFVITKIPDFKNVKENLLSQIDKVDQGLISASTGYTINKTDWEKAGSVDFGILEYAIDNANENVSKQMGYEAMYITNIWFQQYEIGDRHGWHVHNKAAYSNVAFIELPDGGSTLFKINGKEFYLEVNEGEILSFPAMIVHGSPLFKNGRKTIVAYNTDIVMENE